MNWTNGAVSVRWVGGGLWVRWDGGGLLLDAPPPAAGLGAELGALRAILLTSGRIQAVGGLLGVLAAVDRWRDPEFALPVRVVHGDERGPLIAETWQRGWPDRFPVELDAEGPARFELGPFEVRTWAVSASEADFRTGVARPIPALAVRLRGPATIVWIPGAAPGPVVAHLCRGADLAVVEVGVLPRPDRGARLTAADAIDAGAGARLLWLVGDDGEPVEAPGD